MPWNILKCINSWRNPPTKVTGLRVVDADMIVVTYQSGLDASFDSLVEGLHLTIRAYLPDQVTVLALHRGECKITNMHYSRTEGRYVTIQMNRELAKQYVAAARNYIRKHRLHDYQWDGVLPKMYTAMETLDRGT